MASQAGEAWKVSRSGNMTDARRMPLQTRTASVFVSIAGPKAYCGTPKLSRANLDANFMKVAFRVTSVNAHCGLPLSR